MDKHYKEYDMIAEVNGCDKKRLYKLFDDDLQRECYNWAMDEYWKQFGNNKIPKMFLGFGNCVINVWDIYRKLLKKPEYKAKKPKIVFGSMGFKKLCSDDIWWEFG